jgi:hypothetical protein
MTCFLLWHRRYVREIDHEILIGVYASDADASAAINRVKDQPGFRDYPDGFEIHPYEIGKDHWTEGFVTWQQSLDAIDKANSQ